MTDLAINLLASLIAGVAVWTVQRFVRFRKLSRTRAFFGLRQGGPCTISVSRHAGSTLSSSVHRRDLAAAVEVATIVKECGGDVDVVVGRGDRRGVGAAAEFCIGGPYANERTAAHLRHFVPGFRINAFKDDPEGVTMFVGETELRRTRHQEEFVLLIRVVAPETPRAPLWIICGQEARTNQAAAHYLADRRDELMTTYKPDQSFCLALRLLDPDAYDYHHIEVLADLTDDAFSRSSGPLRAE
jgi:hypothetical protein